MRSVGLSNMSTGNAAVSKDQATAHIEEETEAWMIIGPEHLEEDDVTPY